MGSSIRQRTVSKKRNSAAHTKREKEGEKRDLALREKKPVGPCVYGPMCVSLPFQHSVDDESYSPAFVCAVRKHTKTLRRNVRRREKRERRRVGAHTQKTKPTQKEGGGHEAPRKKAKEATQKNKK